MAYVPSIRGYKPFYVQAFSDEHAKDTREWGLVAKSQPYPLSVKVREPYKNTWLDEDGDEEYAEAGIRFESFELEVKFYIETRPSAELTAADLIDLQLQDFLSYMRKCCKHGFYDDSVDIGYKDVRLGTMSVEQDHTKDTPDRAWMIISIKFKVLNPSERAALQTNGDGTAALV